MRPVRSGEARQARHRLTVKRILTVNRCQLGRGSASRSGVCKLSSTAFNRLSHSSARGSVDSSLIALSTAGDVWLWHSFRDRSGVSAGAMMRLL
jgi:hypothetical protein